MGWFRDESPDAGEGFMLGLVEQKGHKTFSNYYRELGASQGDEEQNPSLNAVQAACECGWRSHTVRVQPGRAWYMPYIVVLEAPESYLAVDYNGRTAVELEDYLCEQWGVHAPSCAGRVL